MNAQLKVKPRVVVSECLELKACRYNGEVIRDSFTAGLMQHAELIPVCPEVAIGLGIPRETLRIIEPENKPLLIETATGKDHTARIEKFSHGFVKNLNDIDGFLLKGKSPSCGLRDAKVFPGIEKSMPKRQGPGFFAAAVLENFQDLPAEDEGRLRNYRIREHFLTHLYTRARFRQIKKTRQAKDLVKFQAEHKFIYMAYNQKAMRELGRIAANSHDTGLETAYEEYEKGLTRVFSRMANHNSHMNIAMHAMGYFSDKLSAKEKAFFLDALEKYREDKTPLIVINSLLLSWIERFDEPWLKSQFYFRPYPEDLVELSDSGKKRNSK